MTGPLKKSLVRFFLGYLWVAAQVITAFYLLYFIAQPLISLIEP